MTWAEAALNATVFIFLPCVALLGWVAFWVTAVRSEAVGMAMAMAPVILIAVCAFKFGDTAVPFISLHK